ncbi:MAG: VapC toxin family PIN domain ribonuclease [Acidobacteria bacterium]|nr:VapC toxin family PIN domain ribonuclease [Acidobacteriota bacterium]
MRVYLLDINLLVALLWTNHEQHEAAGIWFRQRRSEWSTCPLTQAGFVRVSSNPRVFPEAPSPGKALEVLEANLRHPRHRFWEDDISFAEAVAPFSGLLTGHQQVTDAYLLGLAVRKGGILATFDAGIAALVETESSCAKSVEILRA